MQPVPVNRKFDNEYRLRMMPMYQINLVRVANANEGAELRALIRLPDSLQLLSLLPPPLPVQVDARWGAEKPLLVSITFLGHFGMQHHHNHVPSDAGITTSEVLFHRLSRQSLLLPSEGRRAKH